MDGEEDRMREELKKCEQCSGNLDKALAIVSCFLSFQRKLLKKL